MSTVGFIGDIHGDLAALQWALEVLSGADLRISLGDVVDGPHESDCIRVLREESLIVLQGNHDAWAVEEEKPALEVGHRQWLASLPRIFEQDDFLAYHSHMETRDGEALPTWVYLQDERSIRRTLAQHPHRLLFCGHAHLASVNVLEPDGRIGYLGTHHLKQQPRVQIASGRRYVVCAGRPDECVVQYHVGNCLEFIFRRGVEPVESWLQRLARSWQAR